MLQLLLYSISYLTIIYGVVLLTKRNRHSTDIILAIWLFFVSTINTIGNFQWEICLTFTHCVFLYLYVKCMVQKSEFKLKYMLHFIPFFCSVFISILFPNIWGENFAITYSVIIIYIVIYFGASLKLINDYKKHNYQTSSVDYSPNLVWLYLISFITITCHAITIIPGIVFYMRGNVINTTIIYVIVLVLLNFVGLKAIRLNLTFLKKKEKESDKSKAYSTYNLKESEINDLEEKLIDLMENQKMYLTPDLSLKDLSESLDVSSHNLSYLLNTKFNQNFYEFTNNYRIEAVKVELINPLNKHLSIYAIASDCGFNSQSTFNRIFKQKVGLSPSKYREQYIPISEDFQ